MVKMYKRDWRKGDGTKFTRIFSAFPWHIKQVKLYFYQICVEFYKPN